MLDWSMRRLPRSCERPASCSCGTRVDVGLEYAKAATVLREARFVFVWNTGRCGSTLVHRALSAAGACSLSEPQWFDQFYVPWEAEPGWKWPDASDIIFLCFVLDCVKQLGGRDSKVFVLNPKGGAAAAFPAVDRAFPADAFDVVHIQMYRNAVDVLESFGSIMFGDTPPPPRTEDLRASHVPALQERLETVDTSLIPHDNFCKDMSLK